MKYFLLEELVKLIIKENRSKNKYQLYSDTGNLDSFNKINKFYEIDENSYFVKGDRVIYNVVFKVRDFFKKKFKENNIEIEDIEIEVIDDIQKFEHDKKTCIEDLYSKIQSKNII